MCTTTVLLVVAVEKKFTVMSCNNITDYYRCTVQHTMAKINCCGIQSYWVMTVVCSCLLC